MENREKRILKQGFLRGLGINSHLMLSSPGYGFSSMHVWMCELECEVKWALESIAMNKASGDDGIPVELFQILKDNAVKVLHSVCQQNWKTQQWP